MMTLYPRRFGRAVVVGLVAAVVSIPHGLFADTPTEGSTTASSTDSPYEKTTVRGPVRATVRLRPTEPRIGDPLRLTLTVHAEEGVELIPVDNWDYLGRFVVAATSTDEAVSAEDGSLTITVDYQLESPLSGTHTIPPLLVEFLDRRPGRSVSPEGEPSYELFTDPIEFEVASLTAEERAALQLAPPLGELPEIDLSALEEERTDLLRHWPWAVAVLGAAIAIPLLVKLVVVLRRRARRRTAFDIAWARLERLAARGRPAGKDVDAYYVELSALTRRYLEDRFELRAPELTTEEFLVEVSRSSVLTGTHQTLLREFLRTADLVKFAHFAPSEEQIDEALPSIRRFLEETRENAPFVELADESPAPRAAALKGAS